MDVVASLDSATKRYKNVTALDNVSFEVNQGEILGLLGPNGAGKTTAVGLLLGLRRPTSGTARLFGGDPRYGKNRTRIGATTQQMGFPSTLTVREVAELVSLSYPSAVPLHELVESFGLGEFVQRQFAGLSSGQQRRVAVALAFCGMPQAVFLDEPTTGLDVDARRALWSLIRDYRRRGGTALLTTHYLEEVEALASRVVVLDAGKAIANDSIETLRAKTGLRRFVINASELPRLDGIRELSCDKGAYSFVTAAPDDVLRQLVAHGVSSNAIEVTSPSLEEIFLHLTGNAQ